MGNFVPRSLNREEVNIPKETFPLVEKFIKSKNHDLKPHWIRAFYGNINSLQQTAEFLYDNESWQEAEGE